MLTTRFKAFWGALFAAVLLGAPLAQAAGTTAGTSIDNRATISYSVSGTPQTPIESAPGGNSTPGAGNGADTSFLVDNRIDFTLVEADATYTTGAPGARFEVRAGTPRSK